MNTRHTTEMHDEYIFHDCGKLMLNGQVSLCAILNLLTLSSGNYLKCFVVENVPNMR